MADVEQRHKDQAEHLLRNRADSYTAYECALNDIARAIADAERRGAESAKAEAQPAGTGWVRLLAQQLRERHDDIRGASDYDHGKKFAFGAALAMLNKLAPPEPSK